MRAAQFLIALVLAVMASAAAQKQTAPHTPLVGTDRLISLKVTGTKRYTDKEILAACGLQIGQSAADGDFKEAVQRIGSSGFFSDVSYSYSSSGTGVRLELRLADVDNAKLVPAEFENFVWFTDAELQSELRARVPLFKQLLPLTGSLSDQVTEALQSILSEKHFPGHVDVTPHQDVPGGLLSSFVYRVEELTIRIHAIEFPGASAEHAALLETAARRLVGAEYGRTALIETAKYDLLPVYQQRGYLKAAFGIPEARVIAQPAAEPDASSLADIQVDAIIPVTPGKVYVSSGVDWKGTSAIHTDEVASLLHLTPGQPADAVRLARDVEDVTKLYRSRGYMTVKVKTDAQFDDVKSAVHYDIDIVEGDQYKMGELDILGLDSQAQARLQAAWTLAAGQPYNADYPKKFLAETHELVPRGVQWSVNVRETPDARDKTVDVEIRFRQQ
jgi:outer membrane protein assembly factor BamA